jgi:hypothetical protein
MSLRKIAARSALVAAGVLASVALMAAPSWAETGIGANAKRCGTYHGALLAQDGSSFTSTAACAKYAAKGGQVVGVNAVAGPVVGGEFTETCSGFGLKPAEPFELNFSCGGLYGATHVVFFAGETAVGADGTVSQDSLVAPCESEGSKLSALEVLTFTAEGEHIQQDFAPPAGC